MTILPNLPNKLVAGDLLPWFAAPLIGRTDRFGIDKMAGKHMLLLFFGSAGRPVCAEAIRLVLSRRAIFDDERALFFGIGIDPADAVQGRIANSMPGIRFFDDIERTISLACGAVDTASGPTAIHPFWLVVDPGLRVLGHFDLNEGEAAIATLTDAVAAVSPDMTAPVLVVPNVCEPEFCQLLVGLYETHGGEETGFMRMVDGKTVGVLDHSVKRRSDYTIADQAVRNALAARLSRRLIPMIKRAFEFQVTRIERYIVACYDADQGGHFRAHRDNTTAGTAHRRFAVTINLNGDYQGGDLRFPEFGMRTYRAPPGAAVVFNCSLLHEATPMTAGRRYATLPFLYDDAAARIREANWATLQNKTGNYRAFAEAE